MNVYTSAALLHPPHGTNGHEGVLIASEPAMWRCQHCHAIAIGHDAWRALIAAGWCPGRLAALPPPAQNRRRIDRPCQRPAPRPTTVSVLDAVASVVRSVVPVWAAASPDPAAASSQGGGVSDGWHWHAVGPAVELSRSGWSRTWPRRLLCGVVARVSLDPDIAGLLDEWRALWTEAGALQTYTPSAGQFVSSDPARSASLDHALRVLRARIEDLYAARAAAELLGIPAQLPLFEAAS